jgi:glycosyltransferase involved in cell wall biosynthesis
MERKLCGAGWDELRQAGRLFVTGLLPRDRVARWMACADAVVMPSLDDGLANGLLEGMAHGLCPVASDIFGDVVTDGVDGVLVAHGNIEALAAAIRKLVANPGAARAMGRQAMDRVSRWTPAMEGTAYLELLRLAGRARESHAR